MMWNVLGRPKTLFSLRNFGPSGGQQNFAIDSPRPEAIKIGFMLQNDARMKWDERWGKKGDKTHKDVHRSSKDLVVFVNKSFVLCFAR